VEAYEPRIVERLVTLAAEARARKDIPRSASYLNRALAFRPDDARLLAEATNLGRAEQFRRNLRTAALALGGSVLFAGLAFGVSRFVKKLEPAPVASVKPAPPKLEAPRPAAPVLASAAPIVDDDEKPRTSTGKKTSAGHGTPAVRPSAAPPSAELARVRIAVDGPANATVKVDGRELDDWFGTQQIPVGTHVFEFIPPNTECCDAGEKLTIEIREPRGPDDLQKVRGRIAFKEAALDFRGAPGSRASCAELGEFPVPSHQTFGMTTAARRVSCTVIPPPGSALPLKPFDVTLSPGRVSSVPPGP
jgi:hypothetical protein